jgi:CheY-like chemotaxis protein
VYADETQLSQILLNLCVNARDAMPSGGRITIATGSVDGLGERFPDAPPGRYITLKVSDTGEGMSEEVRKRIFEPFFTTKERGKGTGLGLSVVYGIIGSHGGYVDVRSRPGKGTIFEVCLPASRERAAAAREVPGAAPQRESKRRTILIVEDEEQILLPVMTLLREQGYDCIPARDGAEALSQWDKYRHRISAILLDLDLPKVNGWEVMTRVRNEDRDARIVLCSGYLDPGRKAASADGGANEFIEKPYELQQVLTVLDRVLAKESPAAA